MDTVSKGTASLSGQGNLWPLPVSGFQGEWWKLHLSGQTPAQERSLGLGTETPQGSLLGQRGQGLGAQGAARLPSLGSAGDSAFI